MTGWEINAGNGRTANATNVTTSILTDVDLYSSVNDQNVRRRSVVALTGASGEQGRGERSFATGPPTTAGAVTVSPVFSTDPLDTIGYEIWSPDGPHPDVIDAAIDRALSELCWYWRLTPLTQLPGGDIGDEIVISINNLNEPVQPGTARRLFTALSGTTVTLPELDTPDEFARRVIRLTGSTSPAYTESVGIDVDPDDRQNWRIEALVNAEGAASGSAGGDTRIIILDLTSSSAVITPEPSDGLQWTRRGFGLIGARLPKPATCNQIAIRLQVQTAEQVGQFAWIQLWEPGRTQFSLPRRIGTKKHVGQVYERGGTRFGQFYPRTFSGNVQRREAVGRGVMLTIQPSPQSKPLFYYEKTPFPTLTTIAAPAANDDDNTTWAELQWVRNAALWECYKFLTHRDEREDPGRWTAALATAEAALRAAQGAYGMEPLMGADSQSPRGGAGSWRLSWSKSQRAPSACKAFSTQSIPSSAFSGTSIPSRAPSRARLLRVSPSEVASTSQTPR